MATKANESEESETDVKTDSGRRKKIMIGVAIVIILALSAVGAYLMFFNKSDEPAELEAEKPIPIVPAEYVRLDPQFVLNFEVENRLRYIQIDAIVKVRSEPIKLAVESHLPVLRSALINLFGRLDFHGMRLPENRQLVADEALTVMNAELAKIAPGVAAEAVLFETFVLQ